MPANLISNPLRYPGNKSALAGYISLVLEENLLAGCTFYEPFAGSAAVTIELADRGLIGKGILIEKDPLLYAFWKSVFNNTEELIEEIEKVEVSIKNWNNFYKFTKVRELNKVNFLEIALAGIFLNRTSYSGIIGGGPLGGQKQESIYKIGCRFNKERVARNISEISKLRDKIEVYYGDALSLTSKFEQNIRSEPSFVYFDPPYFEKGKSLYRFHFDEVDHINLASFLLNKKYPWLLSYDDHYEVRSLYKNSNSFQELYLDYSASRSKKGKEILISNLKIPPLKFLQGVASPEPASY